MRLCMYACICLIARSPPFPPPLLSSPALYLCNLSDGEIRKAKAEGRDGGAEGQAEAPLPFAGPNCGRRRRRVPCSAPGQGRSRGLLPARSLLACLLSVPFSSERFLSRCLGVLVFLLEYLFLCVGSFFLCACLPSSIALCTESGCISGAFEWRRF